MEYINFEHNETAAELVRAAYDTPPLAFVHSYGCQQNVNDGERIKGVLVDIGYGLCDKPEDADLILFNTCAVREHAEQRVFGPLLKTDQFIDGFCILRIKNCVLRNAVLFPQIFAAPEMNIAVAEFLHRLVMLLVIQRVKKSW